MLLCHEFAPTFAREVQAMITALGDAVDTGEEFSLDAETVGRFGRDLGSLLGAGQRIGLAVSGGPDSVALLLLAAAAHPGMIEVATVDHALRQESRAEAESVAALCERLGVPHAILTVEWDQKPQTGIQERAREARYRLLDRWAQEKGLVALLTAHHLDDQVETLLMRLARGAGVSGLAGMRRTAQVPGGTLPLLRPLLGWRHAELELICADAEVTPVADPSNDDAQFERVRVRRALAGAEWLDHNALAISASNLADADAAIGWATTQVWRRAVRRNGGAILFRPKGIPREIRRRLVRLAVMRLATEGKGTVIRGRELDRLLALLEVGKKATLRGVACSGGGEWRFVPAPNRTGPVDNFR
jgi:tRNA(Ile)-lysidine synthase